MRECLCWGAGVGRGRENSGVAPVILGKRTWSHGVPHTFMDLRREQDRSHMDTDPALSVPISLLSLLYFINRGSTCDFPVDQKLMLKNIWKSLLYFHPFISQISRLSPRELLLLSWATQWVDVIVKCISTTLLHTLCFSYCRVTDCLTSLLLQAWKAFLRDPLSALFILKRRTNGDW